MHRMVTGGFVFRLSDNNLENKPLSLCFSPDPHCFPAHPPSWTFFWLIIKKRNTTWDLLSVWRTLTALVMALHRRIVAIIRSWPHPPRSTAWLAGGDLANFGSRLTFVPLPRSTSPPKTFTNTRSEQLFCLPCLYLMTSTKQHKASFDFFDKRVCRSITDSINYWYKVTSTNKHVSLSLRWSIHDCKLTLGTTAVGLPYMALVWYGLLYGNVCEKFSPVCHALRPL